MSNHHAAAVMEAQADFLTEEIDAGPPQDDHPMALLLQESDDSFVNQPQQGDIRHGVVVDKRAGELLIDIGYKSEGIVTGREVDRLEGDFKAMTIGDEVPVYVMREDRDGNLLLSISRARAESDWKHAEELLETQDMFTGSVSGFNRGGVIVKIGQVRGFVPASQLSSESQSQQLTEGEPDNRWMKLMDAELRMKVIDLDRRRNRLILSERVAIREWRREQKERLLESLEENTVCEGVVSSLADFGAFVNLGGADGLIHLSELSWGRISHPKEVVSIGEKIQVMVLNVDRERKRIGLSLRRLLPEPWETVPDRYEVGQIVRGVVTKLVHFGAFARLDGDTIEGLIHISELTERRITHPSEVVTEGQGLELRIIRIDTDKRRMGLSLKQVAPEEESVEFDWEPVPLEENEANAGSTVEAAAEVSAEGTEAASEQTDPAEAPEAAKVVA
ncbi:MAG: S1 RNA-binding domain-containing protein [Caldilineaceae bacterium SB0661_bin_32]|uniref:S1 RNA-binding domain-containing protein n=1 Tax=Caldilineaceae bacterium SB0661_bin_32 TaxID=2605255 RepID=A0A6B1D2I1_9CHLR|nr:S1 RNA-binding domain-containing protein [Caldilineaceae bacterium SB0661_bin_32]